MAENTPKETPQDAPAATPPSAGDAPQAWWAIAAGLAGAGALALAAASFAFLFMQTRTENLLPQTRHLATVVDATLRENIPAQNIIKGAPALETSADGTARWYAYSYEVEVPANLSADGIKTLLRDTMLLQHVSLVEAPGTPSRRTLRLSLGDYHFADLLLHQALPEAPPAADLRAAAYRVARDAEQTLLDSGLAPEAVLRYEPEDQQDGTTIWATTRIDAKVPSGLTANALAAAIEARLADRNVAVNMIGHGAGATLQVLYEGKVCAEIRCSPAAETANEMMPELHDVLPGLVPEMVMPVDKPAPALLESLGEEGDAMAEEEEAESGMPDTAEDAAAGALNDNTIQRSAPDLPVTVPPVRGLSLEPPKARQQPVTQTPRVSIILDDGGWGGETTSRVLSLDPQLTLAILPYAEQDEDTALAAAERGFEIMLHMPMETYGADEKPYPSEIKTAMDKEEIQRLARAAIAEIPGLAGVNNHRGSKFTDDAERMRWFLEVVEELSLYFVDSVTLHTSRAYEVAQSMDIPSARRTIFLDHEKEPDYIRGQFRELIATAKRQGSAIGIGHFRENTVAVLETMLPQLAAEGVSLVHASELVQ